MKLTQDPDQKKKTGNHPGGRPSKINSINFDQLKKLVEIGFTDAQVCDFFGIPERTFNNWKQKNAKFWQSLKDWKKEADKSVEKSLYQRALGYQHEEDKIFCESGKVTVVPTIKHYPPEVLACIYWLNNRQPGVWRQKVEVEHGASDVLIEKFATLTGDELIKKAKELSGYDKQF